MKLEYDERPKERKWKDPKTKANKDCIHYRIYNFYDDNGILRGRNYCKRHGKDYGTCGHLRKTGDCPRMKK